MRSPYRTIWLSFPSLWRMLRQDRWRCRSSSWCYWRCSSSICYEVWCFAKKSNSPILKHTKWMWTEGKRVRFAILLSSCPCHSKRQLWLAWLACSFWIYAHWSWSCLGCWRAILVRCNTSWRSALRKIYSYYSDIYYLHLIGRLLKFIWWMIIKGYVFDSLQWKLEDFCGPFLQSVIVWLEILDEFDRGSCPKRVLRDSDSWWDVGVRRNDASKHYISQYPL